MNSARFDANYFERFYFSADTRIAEPDYFDRLARFLTAYVDLLGCEVSEVLDAACGAGLLHDGLRQAWPAVNIEAFDASEYACQRYGWQCATLQTFATDKTYDLVICHDVLQYLDDRDAEDVLASLADWTRTALFFSVLTREDWEQNCDQTLTDSAVFKRRDSWYRKRLAGEFRNAGGGVFIKRDADVVLYSLESV